MNQGYWQVRVWCLGSGLGFAGCIRWISVLRGIRLVGFKDFGFAYVSTCGCRGGCRFSDFVIFDALVEAHCW